MSCKITGKICDAWSDVAGCGLVRCKFVEEKGGDKRVTDSRKNCPMRHENGNCTVAGGFCTAVNDPICEALHNAFDCGYRSALRKQGQERNAPLTLDELRQMDGEPVWIICDKGFEPLTLWALVEVCEESIFLTNNLGGRTEYAADVELEDDGIAVYRQKPEEDDHG